MCQHLFSPPKTPQTVQSQKKTQDLHPKCACDFSHPHPKQLQEQEAAHTIEKKSIFGYLIILVRCHSNEFGFGEQVGPKCTIRKFQDVIGSDNVKPGLVFMHGVQYSLQGQGGETHIKKGLSGTKRILGPLPG